MLQFIQDQVPRDPAVSERARRLGLFRRVLDGTLYDVLPYEFHEERTAAGEYIPLRLRRPSVRYALERTVVEDSVALLFSAGHFPTFESSHPEVGAALNALAGAMRLNQVMTEAAISGSVGSAAIQLRILRGRPILDVLDTTWLTPVFDPAAPDVPILVRERYKTTAATLAGMGYDVGDASPNSAWWFTREWDETSETWFLPQTAGATGAPEPDPDRSTEHGLGFVPIVWIRNLPGGAWPDGACTFRAAIETSIEIDYQLSQAGRGLKYSSDPTLLIKEPAGVEGEVLRGAGNALVLSEKGDARLLEIGGTASAAVLDYVRVLREFALESVHGNRSDASRLSAPASGRALELMNQGLVWLADNLRVSYGEVALLALARMLIRASGRYAMTIGAPGGMAAGMTGGTPGVVAGDRRSVGRLDPDATVSLSWPDWHPPGPKERATEARTLAELVKAGLLSRATATRVLAGTYGVHDPGAETDRIDAERKP